MEEKLLKDVKKGEFFTKKPADDLPGWFLLPDYGKILACMVD